MDIYQLLMLLAIFERGIAQGNLLYILQPPEVVVNRW
jgi:hypothetical protein